MRTLTTGPRRDATTALVRQRVDALFTPGYVPGPTAGSTAGPTDRPPARLAAGPAVGSTAGLPGLPGPTARPIPDPSPQRATDPIRRLPRTGLSLTGPSPTSSPTGPTPSGGSSAEEYRGPLSDAAPSSHARGRRFLPLALQERFDLDRRAVIGLAVLLVLALGYGVQHFWAGRPEPVAVPAAVQQSARPSLTSGGVGDGSPVPSPTRSEPMRTLVVDVAGKVRTPGVRTLPLGSRVQDALKAAGGAVPGTDLTGLNLARPLTDGEEVVVGPGPGAPVGAAAPGGGPVPGPLSLNTATLAQLDTLPGVGPVLAQRIVQFRDQHGGFTSVDQLQQVSGVGERRMQDLRPLLRP